MLVAVDTEFPGLEVFHGIQPFIISTCDEHFRTRLWEWPVDPKTRKVDINRIELLEVAEYLDGKELIFQHGVNDLRILANAGLRISSRELEWTPPSRLNASKIISATRIHETMMMSHLVDSRGVYTPDGRNTHALKELCLVHLDFSDSDETALRKATVSARLKGKNLGWTLGRNLQGESEVGYDYFMVRAYYDYVQANKKKNPKLTCPDEWKTLARTYADNDAIRTMLLFQVAKRILEDDGRWQMYLDELELIPIIYLTEETGMYIHDSLLRRELHWHNEQIRQLGDRLVRLSGNSDYNINSYPQLRELLFHRWSLGSTKRTGTGLESTEAEVLEDLRDWLTTKESGTAAEPISLIEKKALEFLRCFIGYWEESRPVPGYRTHKKASEYLTFYESELVDSRFHASTNPVGTKTTRFSTKGSQNIGKKELVDKETGEEVVLSLRSVFGPPPECLWASIDYSQLELRIFAHFTQDQSLINSFNEGHDFHAYVAERIFNLPPEKISKEQRTIAKNTNFAMIFGGSPGRVDATAGMKGAYDAFSHQFPSAHRFMEETIAYAREHGHVLTADGYPLWVPPGEPYKGTDYRIQGTAGRIIKLAMRWLCYGREGGYYFDENGDEIITHELAPLVDWDRIKIVAQIHDELVFQVKTSGLSRVAIAAILRKIATVMEEAGDSMGIITPVDVEIHARDWSHGISMREYLADKTSRLPKASGTSPNGRGRSASKSAHRQDQLSRR